MNQIREMQTQEHRYVIMVSKCGHAYIRELISLSPCSGCSSATYPMAIVFTNPDRIFCDFCGHSYAGIFEWAGQRLAAYESGITPYIDEFKTEMGLLLDKKTRAEQKLAKALEEIDKLQKQFVKKTEHVSGMLAGMISH